MLESFVSFSRSELSSGGPDHHLRTIADIARSRYGGPEERAWAVCCYAAPYNVPAGLAILDEWPLDRPLDGIEGWLVENWRGIPIRKEKRAVRSPAKMARHIRDLRAWASGIGALIDAAESFEDLWSSMRGVWGAGRYTSCKLLEGVRRAGVTSVPQPDIRPNGAKYPRRALSFIHPEHAEELNATGTRTYDAFADGLARGTATAVPAPDVFTAEVLLCDWQQALRGSYYPGRPLDSEIDQARQVSEHFGTDLAALWDVRASLFPPEHLGEAQGWSGRRKELGATWDDHGYWWSDLELDYVATADLADPVRR